MTNNTGWTEAYYRYHPYGEIYISSGSYSLIPIEQYTRTLLPSITNANPSSLYFNTRLFTWREYDREVSLSYHRARYYSPQLGRFLQTDPLWITDDLNLYRYVKNSPLTLVDRDGRKAKEATIALWNYWKNVTWEITQGAIQGDFIQNPNWWNTAGQIWAWLIPFYWQASDIRDVWAAWNNCVWMKECIQTLSLAWVGFIPWLWDALKVWAKWVKNADEIIEIAESVTKKYWNFECDTCAKELSETFTKNGIENTSVKIQWNPKYWLQSNLLQQNISTNWYHEGVRVWDTVYDNIHKSGIDYNGWEDDFGVWWPGWPKIIK